jgi:DNA-binding MarR family transcriptional regulator
MSRLNSVARRLRELYDPRTDSMYTLQLGTSMADGHEVAMALRAAYLAMHRRTDAAMARHGVTADQFVLLTALSNGAALTQRDLARQTGSDPNTVRAMLVLLEKRGLIARTPHPSDGRALTVALTAAGKKTYRSLWTASEPVRASLLSALGTDSPQSALALLHRFARTLTPPTPDAPSPRTRP